MNDFIFALLILLWTSTVSAQVVVGNPINCLNYDAVVGGAISLDGSGTRIVVGFPAREEFDETYGRVKVFDEIAGNWVQIGSTLESTQGILGSDVSISRDGNRIAVPVFDNIQMSQVRIYEYDGNDFILIDSIVSSSVNYFFGRNLHLNSDGSIIVFSDLVDTYVYFENSTSQFVPLGQKIENYEGVSITDDGGRIAGIVNSGTGNLNKAAVFDLNLGLWEMVGALIGNDDEIISRRGVELNGSGTRIVVSSVNSLSRDLITNVYEEDNTQWQNIGQDIRDENLELVPNDAAINASGDVIAISKTDLSFENSYVRTYELINGTWYKKGNDPVPGFDVTLFAENITISSDGQRIATSEILLVGSGGAVGQAVVYEFITLPINLNRFSASKNNGVTELLWETLSEENNAGFIIQRSEEGINWIEIGYIESNESGRTINNYMAEDISPLAGQNYYRLKQIDTDGHFTYSNVILIEHNRKVDVFPNPSSGLVNVSIAKLTREDIKITIQDYFGKLIWQAYKPKNESNVTEQIELLESGLYHVSVQIGSEVYRQRVIVFKR